MDNRDGMHALAAWVRRPQVCALTVAVLGLASLLLSLLVPVGLGAVALATIGAVSLVAGTLTLAVLLLGRLTGMHRRADEVVVEGRRRIPSAGRSGPVPAAADPSAAAEEPAAPTATVLDITEPIDVRAPVHT